MKISLVIPTYDEKNNIEELIRRISGTFFHDIKTAHEIIFVDDNSPDGTGELLEQLKKDHPLKIVHRKAKLGLSSAVIEGFKIAEGDILGVMDADLSHPPEVIPDLVRPILDNRADFAIASRYAKGGGVEVWPLHRRFISFIATLVARPLTKVKDPMSGFFFFKKGLIEHLKLDSKGYKICLELLVKTRFSRVKEIPYTFRNREVGQSKLSFKEYFKYLKDLLKLIKYKIL